MMGVGIGAPSSENAVANASIAEGERTRCRRSMRSTHHEASSSGEASTAQSGISNWSATRVASMSVSIL